MPTYSVVYETTVLVHAPDEAGARAHVAIVVGSAPIVRIDTVSND